MLVIITPLSQIELAEYFPEDLELYIQKISNTIENILQIGNSEVMH